MIPQRSNRLIKKLFAPYLAYRLRKAFKTLKYDEIEVLPGHSVLLLCNHFSWWDGFFAGHLTHTYLKRDFFIMMQEDHLQKRMFLNRIGGFSINRKSKEVVESLQYAAKLLDDPDNLVTVFPQGALESNHIDEINIERGIDYIVKKIKGDCQIIYYSAFIEYFESLKPSVYFRFLNCGTNRDFDFERLKTVINHHHKKALKEQVNAEH
ncbi:lysophospholipid acyltransferase family protein [Mucilaginibacter sp. BT774]|uniref:lysophospholipid acyltransferase family protein n=1 Tax=Mucilaginibacter sp. BT774 TaxID=3062276 RepID=UPI00267599FB|nr:lysophospholipid acyltransferase family protein [Mucilaginibacter sp. BT774]MDO3625512.1 lysophospholipid acyltransferase family protein [Mucilaginibacter sp. BT774]